MGVRREDAERGCGDAGWRGGGAEKRPCPSRPGRGGLGRPCGQAAKPTEEGSLTQQASPGEEPQRGLGMATCGPLASFKCR